MAKPTIDESGERAKIAKKYGFDAYAVSDENPDPVANAIGLLLEHVHQMDNKVVEMCHAIQEIGGDVCTQDLPKVDLQDFVDSGIEPTPAKSSDDFDPHI